MTYISRTIRLATLLIVGISIAVHGYAQTYLTNGLVAYYPFNGGAADASGNGHNGTVYGATLTTNRFGNPNAAYYFNGTSAYITTLLTGNVFSGDFTASVWFKALDHANPWPQMLYEQNENFNIGIAGDTCGCNSPGFLNSGAVFAPATHSWFLRRPMPTPLNTYCQVVITKAGTNVAMYLNGQIASTSKVVHPSPQPGQYLSIGRAVETESIGGNTSFHGVIDDIRIYNVALSSNTVLQLYAHELQPQPQTDLIKAVKPSLSNLAIGATYQLQVSGDLITWTNQGTVFAATNSSMVNMPYFDVPNWNQLFFRVVTSP